MRDYSVCLRIVIAARMNSTETYRKRSGHESKALIQMQKYVFLSVNVHSIRQMLLNAIRILRSFRVYDHNAMHYIYTCMHACM